MMSGVVPYSAHFARYRSSCSLSATYGRSGGTATAQPCFAARSYVRSDVPASTRSGHPEQPEHVCRGRELREEEVLDRGVGVVAEPVGVLDLLEHLAVEPVVRLPGPTLDLGVDAEPHVVALAFSRSATGRRRGRDSSRPPVSPLGRRMSTIAISNPRASSAVPDGT